MTSLESIVLPLAESRALVERGIVLETALAWYPEHCDDYEAPAPASLWPDEWKRIAEGQPVVCVREEMEDHEPICPAPVLSELLDAIRAIYPDAEIISRCTWPGAAWVIHYGENGYHNSYGDTVIQAAAALLMEVKP
jgi:hypothetical protein